MFGRKKRAVDAKEPVWQCENGCEPHYLRHQEKLSYDGVYCNFCASYYNERTRKRRKRQEELAAMVAGRLASQMPGFRDEGADFSLTAAEAMRLAKAIMDQPGEGKDYDR